MADGTELAAAVPGTADEGLDAVKKARCPIFEGTLSLYPCRRFQV
jgi:hypothetical protein